MGVVGVAAWSRWPSSSAAPPSRSCRRRCSATACSWSRSAVALVVGFALFGSLTYLPLFQQIVRGLTPTASGLQLIPVMGGLLISSIVSGQVITRTGRYKAWPIAGTAVAALGMWMLSSLDETTGDAAWRRCTCWCSASGSGWSCRCWSWPSRTRSPTSSSAWRRRARRCSARSAARSAPRCWARSSRAG